MEAKLLVDMINAGATAVIAITSVVALVYAHFQLKNSRDTEKVKHLVEFNREFDSEPISVWRKSLAQQRLNGVAFPDEALRLIDFFETIGLLVRRGYLDVDDVWNTFSYWIFNIYADFRDDIEQIRRDDDNYYSDFCDLLERLSDIEHAAGSKDDRPSKEEITEFWRVEVKSVPGTPTKTRKSNKI